MNIRFLTLRVISMLALLWVWPVGVCYSAGIGFQARLTDPPAVVSFFDAPNDRFSAAMSPQSYPRLSNILKYQPELYSTSFDRSEFGFRVAYSPNKYLVPIAVDADQFMNFRLTAYERERRGDIMSKSLIAAQREKRKSGLQIGIGLPKRLDRIFGEGGGNLKVSGYRRISFSGRSQWSDAANSDLLRQNKFPTLNMEQTSRFEITGTIGSKISVKVAQDSQTDIPLANRIQIRYKGDDDDVLKTIEAGNTTLSLSGARFVGYSSRIQGLFGLRAEAQVGNLKLTAIASQEKGSSERATINAAGEENANIIRDYNYVDGRIFDLGYPADSLGGGALADFNRKDSVVKLIVYEKDTQDSVANPYCRTSIDPNNESLFNTYKDEGRFRLVPQDAYDIYQDTSRGIHAVYFRSARTYALGAWYVVRKWDSTTLSYARTYDTVGDLNPNGASDAVPKKLKQLRAINPIPTSPSWWLMWRNLYSIPKDARVEDLNIDVYRGLAGSEGTTNSVNYQTEGDTQRNYLEIFGLDQYNRSDLRIPDRIVDELDQVYRPDWGLIIFPNRLPFASDTTFALAGGNTTPALTEKVPLIYNGSSSTARSGASKYYVRYSSSSRSSIIRLNRTNIIEGSERVTLNGTLLTKDTDYRISYDLGQVTMLTDAALDPNADINVEFEYAPFLSLQKKTLLGMRAEYEWSKNLRFGSTILYKSDKAQERKPRVGQETATATVLDFDMSFNLYPNFITKALNALPLISTETPSSITVAAEIAQSHPNPNIDGRAFVDDFESTVENMSLGNSRTRWTMSSIPRQLKASGKPYQRGALLWHNPPQIAWQDVYRSEKKVGEGNIAYLRMIFVPRPTKISLDSTGGTVTTSTKSWAGVMQYFGNRVDEKRVRLFEVRLNTPKGAKGRLHFDFGRINEDINDNDKADTEDKDFNGAATAEEDVGLDGLPDSLETDQLGQKRTAENPDPSGDDWWYDGSPTTNPPAPASLLGDPNYVSRVNDVNNPLHYAWINGTEGNRSDPSVQGYPDEERLTSSLQQIDAYYSFEVNLDTSRFLVPNSDFNGWRTYQIPVRDSASIDTTVVSDASLKPSWSEISHVRVWFEADSTETDTVWVDIANWGFIQTNWQDSLIVTPANRLNLTQSEFHVSSISEDENETFRNSNPPGEQYVDKSTNITEPRRALAMVYSALNPGDTGMVVKELISVEQYSGYRRMEMYVYGSPNTATDSVMMFFRLGRDSVNFYEFHTRLHPGWDTRNYVNIDFNEITELKDAGIRALDSGVATSRLDTSSDKYRVRGAPNINQIKFFACGIVNKDSLPITTGEVWIDEQRVTEVRKDVGTAARVDISSRLADIGTVSFSYESTDPYFRGLSATTRGGSSNNLGSGSSNTTMSYGFTTSLEKFIPKSWGAALPINYRYTKTEQKPLLRTGTDIVLAADIRAAEMTTSTSQTLSTSASFSKKTSNPLYSVLLNRQRTSFSYSRSRRTSVLNPKSFSENISVRSDYEMGIKSFPRLPIFFWTKSIPYLNRTSKSTLGLYPDQWHWNANFSRTISISENKDKSLSTSLRRDFDGSMNLSQKVFENLQTGFSYSTRRDLTDPDLVSLSFKDFKLGLETNFSQSFRGTWDPKLLNWFTTSLSYNGSYSDVWDRSTKTRRSDMQRSWSVSGQFRHLGLLGGDRKSSSNTGMRPAPVPAAKAKDAPPKPGEPEAKPEKPKPKPKPSGPPFYDPPLKVMRWATGWVNPFTYKYNRAFTNSVPGLLERPSMMYRLGFRDDPNVLRGGENRSPNSGESFGYELGSGFKFLGGFITDVKYRHDVTRDLIVVGTRSEQRSTSWPDLAIRIQQFTSLPLFRKQINGFIRVFSPRTGYSRQVKEDVNLETAYFSTRSESINRNPLLGLNFILARNLSMSGSYSLQKTVNEKYNYSTGGLETETRTTNKTIAATAKYSFSAPGGISIPLFGKMRFTSTMSIDVAVRYNLSKSDSRTGAGAWALVNDKSDLSIAPVISYVFSQQITGGLTARWQDSNDNKIDKKNHVRELQIWTEIKF